MIKKTAALLLALAMIVCLFGCGRKSDLDGGVETNADGSIRELASETKYNFLVMGHDRQASLTDVMMLVSYDTDAGDMTIMQLPRDTYIEVGDYSYHKINGLYNHCVSEAKDEKSADPQLEGCKRAADYLARAFGIKIHYSAVMDLDGFGAIVDAIGGVYMYVPYSMKYNDKEQNLYIDLPEGYNTLDGDEAEQFVRYRSGFVNADLGRGDAQKMFMTAFIESVKKNIGISNVTEIATAILRNVKTDMKAADIIKIGKSFLGIELSDITMLTVPGEVCSSYYVINKDCLGDVLNESFNIFADSIEDSELDTEIVFCDEDNGAMKTVYEKLAAALDYDKHNAQDVSDEDIYIPLK